MSKALDGLVDLLNLEQIEADIFRGRSPDDWRQRVFGGQVAGQALVAAGRTFPTRRVSAIQHGKTIFTLSASFHHFEPGPVHAEPMPEVPPPDSITPLAERMEKLIGPDAREFFARNPIDLRILGPV